MLRSIWSMIRPRTARHVKTGEVIFHFSFRHQLGRFIRDALRGRPMICNSCGKEITAGSWIQRVRVPALPWTMWRHRRLPCGPGTERW